MKRNTMLLIGAAVAAYFIFGRKAQAAQPVMSPVSAPTTAAGLPGPTAPGWVDPAKKILAGALDIFGQATESRGIEGMVPAGGLNGHMAALGAFGELGGSFYGGF